MNTENKNVWIEEKDVLKNIFLKALTTLIAMTILQGDLKRFRLPGLLVIGLSIIMFIIYVGVIRKFLRKRKKRYLGEIIRVLYIIICTVVLVYSFLTSSFMWPRYTWDQQNYPIKMLRENSIDDFDISYFHSKGITVAIFDPDTLQTKPFSYPDSNYLKRDILQYKGADMIVTTPHNTVKICEGAFSTENNMNCAEIQNIILQEGVEEIDAHAFYGCCNIKSIVLPRSVSSIDESAFDGCENTIFLVYRNSYAYDFCSEHGLQYEIIPV